MAELGFVAGRAADSALDELRQGVVTVNRFVELVEGALRGYDGSGGVVVAPAAIIGRPLLAATWSTSGRAGVSASDLVAVGFTTAQAEDLLGGRYTDRLTEAVLAGLAVPDDTIRDAVAEAVEGGHTPAEAGIDSAYFPEVLVGRPVGRSEAVALTSEATGGGRWEGEIYGRWLLKVQTHKSSLGGSHWSGPPPELVAAGRRIAARPGTALSFYDTIGAEGATLLATVIGGPVPADNREVVDDYAIGLASASWRRDSRGSAALAFGSTELLAQPLPPADPSVARHSPALLFQAGRFDPGFLADATVFALVEGHDGTLVGSPPNRAGDDPRNILLARAATDPVVIEAVMAGLGHDLDPLLAPGHRFTISSVEWGGPAPIVGFLGAAGRDPVLATRVVNHAGNRAEPLLADPATALGVELIMAQHAEVMIPAGDLEAVGVDPSTLDVDPEVWRQVYGEVLRWGWGQRLADATGRLLDEAIPGAVSADGRFSASKLARFAHLYGRADTEATEALFEHAAGLDDQARERNRQANLAASLFFSGVGLAPGAGPALGNAGSAGWAWFFEGYPTDHELNERRERYEERRFGDEQVRWERAMWSAWLDAQFTHGSGPATLDVVLESSDTQVTTVPLRRGDAAVEWQQPATGQWSTAPTPELGAFRALFPASGDGPPTTLGRLVSEAGVVGEDYRDGEIRAAEDREVAETLLAKGGGVSDDDAALLYEDGRSAAAWTDRWVPSG